MTARKHVSSDAIDVVERSAMMRARMCSTCRAPERRRGSARGRNGYTTIRSDARHVRSTNGEYHASYNSKLLKYVPQETGISAGPSLKFRVCRYRARARCVTHDRRLNVIFLLGNVCASERARLLSSSKQFRFMLFCILNGRDEVEEISK